MKAAAKARSAAGAARLSGDGREEGPLSTCWGPPARSDCVSRGPQTPEMHWESGLSIQGYCLLPTNPINNRLREGCPGPRSLCPPCNQTTCCPGSSPSSTCCLPRGRDAMGGFNPRTQEISSTLHSILFSQPFVDPSLPQIKVVS